MNVSEVRVFPVPGNSKLKAKADVTFLLENGARLAVKGFRVHDDGEKPPWVGVPTERVTRNGKTEYFNNIWIDAIGQSQVYPKIIEEYNRLIKK